MAENLESVFSRIGVSVYSAQLEEDGVVFTATPLQFNKIKDMTDVTLRGINENNHIIGLVEYAALTELAGSGTRARRGTGATAEIVSYTVYDITVSEEAANAVTTARWNSDTKEGHITVNDAILPVTSGKAGDHYPDAVGSKADRAVFVLTLNFQDGSDDTLVSYGFTNLIRRVVNESRQIVG